MRIPGTLNLALLGGVAAMSSALLWIASHGTLWQTLLAAVAFSFFNNTMFSLLHESVHGIAHENRRVNEAIGTIAAAFFPTALSLQRVFHLGHHARNRTAEEQFDIIHPADNALLKRAQWYAILTGLYWVFVPLGGLVYLIAPSLLTRIRAGESATQTGASSIFAGLDAAPRGRIRAELVFTIVVQAGLFWLLDLTLAGWLLCYAAFAVNWSSLQYTDHAFSKLDVRDGAWNLRVNPLTRLLFLNYHHHLAHHRHPHVPWLHLGRYVDEREERPSFWEIYWRMWRGPIRFIPPEDAGSPVPPAAPEPQAALVHRRSRVYARDKLSQAAVVGAFFALCYTTASWITAQYATLPVWDLPFESRIPFVPGMSVAYLTIVPVLLLAPFVFRTRNELAPLAAVVCLETFIATACFLLFPQTTSFVRPEVTGWARYPFALADAMNLSYNQFPSLHVTFACTAAWAYALRSRTTGKIAWALWAIVVAASTSLMWEHHLVDIAGGALLAASMMMLVYPRYETLRVELICLEQCARFSRRHVRYFVIFLAIYGPSLLHWRRYRAVRTGFCAAQWIDDLLDGDRASAREPLDVVEELVSEMSSGAFSSQPLSRLTAALFAELPAEGRSDFIALVRTMQRDRRRVLGGEVWTAEELDAHHRATFRLSVNLMLLTSGCTARAEEVPSLIEALAWCSVFRDLDDDLRKGLINIPRDAWEGGPDARDAWAHAASLRAAVAIERAADEIARLRDARARRILGIFQSSIARFRARRHPRPASDRLSTA